MSRDALYRSVFRNLQDSPMSCDSFSPVSSLAQSLHASSLAHTPCKRLSLSSSISDASDLNHDLSFHSASPEIMGATCPSPFNQCSPIDKENVPTTYYSPIQRLPLGYSSPLQEVQNVPAKNLSFSPLKKPISPSKGEFSSPVKKVSPPDEHDSNSRDSGYCESSQKQEGVSVPLLNGPTRKLNLDMSPPKVTIKPAEKKMRSFASLSRSRNEDAFLMEMLSDFDAAASESTDEPSSSLSSLLSAPIQCNVTEMAPKLQFSGPRLPIRRCLSMVDSTTPLSSRRRCILGSPNRTEAATASPTLMSPPSTFNFKRPQPPMEVSSPSERKRPKLEPLSTPTTAFAVSRVREKLPLTQRHMSAPENENQMPKKIQRSHSETHLSIMKALNKSSVHSELTGDFSRSMVLPLITGGKHPDLKCISIHTLASLIKGEFKEQVESFRILDCRYPYEYEGGHIKSAVNWHTPQMALDLLDEQSIPPKVMNEKSPRRIYIFHCEFSAERAPKIQRILRETDRQSNKEHYPALYFPEIYLLDGGYKAFYELYPDLCSPSDYVKMIDENHTDDLKHFRAKSKSWAAETKQGGVRGARVPVARTGRKKLGL